MLFICFYVFCCPVILNSRRLFCVFFSPCLSLSTFGFDCKTKTQTVVPSKSASLNVSRCLDDLLSAPAPPWPAYWWLRCLAWLCCVNGTACHPSMAFRLTGIISVRSVSMKSKGRAFLWGMTLPNLKRKYLLFVLSFSLLSGSCSKWS